MNRTDYAYRVTSQQKVYLNPDELNYMMEDTIRNRLKEYEGTCINMGYIMRNSVVMIDRKVGKIPNSDMIGGKILFDISYQMALISPKPQHIIPCVVEEINKIGVLAFGGIEDNNPLWITLIKQNHPDVSVFKDISKGDHIVVKVLSSKCKLKEKMIQVTGLFVEKITKEEYDLHKEYMTKKLFLNRTNT